MPEGWKRRKVEISAPKLWNPTKIIKRFGKLYRPTSSIRRTKTDMTKMCILEIKLIVLSKDKIGKCAKALISNQVEVPVT